METNVTLKIVQIGDPVLRRRARPLLPAEIQTSAIQNLIELMRDTMRAAPGVGLAAPQIGAPLQLAVIEDRPEFLAGTAPNILAERERSPVPFHVIINPELSVVGSSTAQFFEGCLSMPAFTALVPRALEVHVTCLNELGEQIEIDARGWYARILQHEIDHLHGSVYIDRMHSRSLMTGENYARFWKDKSIRQVLEELGLA
jgi:peptide deformylase